VVCGILYRSFMFRRPRAAAALAALCGALALAAPALAAPSAPPAPSAPAGGSARLYLPDVFFVHHEPVTVPHRVWHVVGIVRPYLPGQWLTVAVRLGRRVIRTARVSPAVAPNRTYGHFRLAIASPASGTLVISVAHRASPQLRAFHVTRVVGVLDAQASFGSRGRFIALIQQRLAALHFYIPQTGVYDQSTGLALDAYHRLLRWGTSQSLDGRTISFLLDGFGAFHVRFPHHGRHAEGNLSLQLLALVDGNRVDAIYPISSGKPSTPTITGDFHVYSKVAGYLPDGMYDSNFFIRGYAIHGYDPAPDYPASHGCMRLPIGDAPSVYGWLGIGDWVDVYY